MSVERLCGDHGIVQFASGDEPDLASGFCLELAYGDTKRSSSSMMSVLV